MYQQRFVLVIAVSTNKGKRADKIFTDFKSSYKTLMEKPWLIDALEDKDKQSLYYIIDTFIAKKKLKDNLSTVLQKA